MYLRAGDAVGPPGRSNGPSGAGDLAARDADEVGGIVGRTSASHRRPSVVAGEGAHA